MRPNQTRGPYELLSLVSWSWSPFVWVVGQSTTHLININHRL